MSKTTDRPNSRAPRSHLQINGELVILVDGRLSVDALQRRLVTAPSKARALVTAAPASYVAFDLLAIGGVEGHAALDCASGPAGTAGCAVNTPPLQLSPVTADIEEAREWFDVLPEAIGIEGLVVKGASSRYAGGRRDWLRDNSVGVDGVGLVRPRQIVRGQMAELRVLVVCDRCRGRVAC